MASLITSFDDLLANKGIESLGNCRINATTKRQLCCKCLEMKNLGNSNFIPFACLLRIGQNVAQYNDASQSAEGLAKSSDPHWTRKLFCGNCDSFFSSLDNEVDNIYVGKSDIRVFPRLTNGKFREQSAWCGLGYTEQELKLPVSIDSKSCTFFASVIFRCILIHKEAEHVKKLPNDAHDAAVASILHKYFTSGIIKPDGTVGVRGSGESVDNSLSLPPIPFCVALECSDSDFAARKPRPWDCSSESYDAYQSLYWTADAGTPGHVQIGHVHIYYGPAVEQWKYKYVSVDDPEFQKVHKTFIDTRDM